MAYCVTDVSSAHWSRDFSSIEVFLRMWALSWLIFTGLALLSFCLMAGLV